MLRFIKYTAQIKSMIHIIYIQHFNELEISILW